MHIQIHICRLKHYYGLYSYGYAIKYSTISLRSVRHWALFPRLLLLICRKRLSHVPASPANKKKCWIFGSGPVIFFWGKHVKWRKSCTFPGDKGSRRERKKPFIVENSSIVSRQRTAWEVECMKVLGVEVFCYFYYYFLLTAPLPSMLR